IPNLPSNRDCRYQQASPELSPPYTFRVNFPGGARYPPVSARSILSAIEEANDRSGAFRSDLRSYPTPTPVPGSPTEPQGSWPSLRGRVIAQPDPDILVPIESPETFPHHPGIT